LSPHEALHKSTWVSCHRDSNVSCLYRKEIRRPHQNTAKGYVPLDLHFVTAKLELKLPKCTQATSGRTAGIM